MGAYCGLVGGLSLAVRLSGRQLPDRISSDLTLLSVATHKIRGGSVTPARIDRTHDGAQLNLTRRTERQLGLRVAGMAELASPSFARLGDGAGGRRRRCSGRAGVDGLVADLAGED